MRIAIDGMFREQLERLFSAVEFTDADLARLRADLQRAQYQGGLLQAMYGERVIGLATIQNPTKAVGNEAPLFSRLRLIHGNDTRCYLECMELVVAKAKLPLPQAFAGIKQLDADLAATMGASSPLSPAGNPMTKLLMPSLTGVLTAATRGTASNETADAALAVEQYRRRYGKLPEQLDDLMPEFLQAVPDDAFDGQPLRYIVGADGYVVYSVGQDLIDQGGLKGPIINALSDPGDLTFEVKRGRKNIDD